MCLPFGVFASCTLQNATIIIIIIHDVIDRKKKNSTLYAACIRYHNIREYTTLNYLGVVNEYDN